MFLNCNGECLYFSFYSCYNDLGLFTFSRGKTPTHESKVWTPITYGVINRAYILF